MGSASKAAPVVLCAAVAGQVYRFGALAPLLLAAVLVAGNVALLRWRRWRVARPSVAPARFVGLLTASWLVVMILPVHKFSHRGVSATGPNLTIESLIEVLAFAVAGVVALVVIRTLEPTLARSRPPMLLLLYPVWVGVTGVWGSTGLYAMVRGGQLVVTALLAWATVALGRVDIAAVDELVGALFRWFVRVTLVLVALGVLLGPLYVSASEANLDRFTWVGAHPLGSGLVLSVATIIVLSQPLQTLRLRRWMRVLVVVVLVAALVPNHSRQSWLGLAVVLLVALGLAGRLTPLFRWVGAPLLGAAVVMAVWFRGPAIWDYVLRDEDSQTLSTGNGRIELWSIGFRALHTPFDWLFGLGHGVTRTLFIPEAPWAHSAHSSFLAALVSGGLVGLALLVVLIVSTAWSVLTSRVWASSAAGFALTLLFVFVLLNGVVSDNLSEPNLGFSMLYLIAAAALVRRSSPSVAVGELHRAVAPTGARPRLGAARVLAR